MEEVLVIDRANVPDAAVVALARQFTVHEAAPDEAAIEGLVTTWQSGFSAELIATLPALKAISVHGTGDQTLDLAAAAARGIGVATTAIDGTDDCVADLALAFALALARRILQADDHVRAGGWLAAPFAPTTHLGGKRAGIVGLGFIGRKIARRAEAFDMAVSYADVAPVADAPYPYVDSAERLAREVDFLFVSCRGGPEADGLIDARILDALGPGGYLIHIAQARFYNEADLVAALQARKIAGAAIDIFPDEPRVHPALPALDNVILSPHVGAITSEILARRAELVATNLRQLLDGEQFAARLV